MDTFSLMQSTLAGNMALLINDYHIVFGHMDAYHSSILGYSFSNSDWSFIEKTFVMQEPNQK